MTALKTGLTFFLIWVILGGFTAEAQDTKPLRGVALIIGQANYAHVTPLPNAAADARAIGKLMTDLGFETRLAPDRNAKSLKREIDRFIEDAEGADVALVYYAGHGIEAAGENWLVPVDADLSSLADARERLVPAAQLVDRLKQAAPVVIFLLDACRNSPFPADALLKPDAQSPAVPVVATGLMPSRGAAVIEDQPAPVIENVGTVMGFSAEPGHAALDGPKDGNSPYAQALLRHLSALGGADFGDVMTMVTEEVYLVTQTRQRPWVNASMRRLIYFGAAPQESDKDEAAITGERRKLLLTIAALPETGRRQVEGIAKADQVPLDSLYGMLRSLGAETPKDPAELDTVLRAQAERLKSILTENTALKSADPEIIRLSALADRAVAQGAIETAIGFREQAKKRAATRDKALDQAEVELAARRAELAEVYAKSGETYMLAFDYARGAEDFEQAFGQVRQWNQDAAWKYKRREGEALAALGFYKGDKAALNRAKSAFEEAERLLTSEDKPEEWGQTISGLSAVLRVMGEREQGTDNLRESASILRAALAKRAEIKTALDWSGLENNLAMALWRLGERESSPQTLEQAAAMFEAALADVPKGSSPISMALIENNLGVVLTAAGQRDAGLTAFDKAIGVLERALGRIVKEDSLAMWAIMENNLATVLSYKGQRESGTETLERSATAFRSTLSALRRDTAPLAWATASNNLGMVLLRLGERQRRNDDLLAADKEFSSALEEITLERSPLDWANVMNNRGMALTRLGEREAGTARLMEAIATFDAALTVLRRDVMPLIWADCQRNLGIALLALGQRQTDTQAFKRAVVAFENAASELTHDRALYDWATVTLNLGVVLSLQSAREQGTVTLDKAIAVLNSGVAADFRSAMPSQWTDMNYHLGNALLEKARRETSATAPLADATKAYHAAQDVATRAVSPLYWAEIETNMASIHYFMGQRTHNKAEFEAARASTLAAWDVFKGAGDTTRNELFKERLDDIDGVLKSFP